MTFLSSQMKTNQGQQVSTDWQIVDVTRPLMSVHQICAKGNVVVFTSAGGYIENKNGARTHFERSNNVNTLQLHAYDPGSSAPTSEPIRAGGGAENTCRRR